MVPELIMLRTVEVLYAVREQGSEFPRFLGGFSLGWDSGAGTHKQAEFLLPKVFLVPTLNRFSFGGVTY